MSLKVLTWSFAGLFLLFGLAMAASDDAGWREVWAGLTLLSLGSFSVAMVAEGVASGRIRARYSVVRRADRPFLFWTTVALVGGAGVVVTAGGAWILVAGEGF